jgi:hypothetical protein
LAPGAIRESDWNFDDLSARPGYLTGHLNLKAVAVGAQMLEIDLAQDACPVSAKARGQVKYG